jgi:hypothetical protein
MYSAAGAQGSSGEALCGDLLLARDVEIAARFSMKVLPIEELPQFSLCVLIDTI